MLCERFERSKSASKAGSLSVSLTELGAGTEYRARNRMLMRHPRRLLLPPGVWYPIEVMLPAHPTCKIGVLLLN